MATYKMSSQDLNKEFASKKEKIDEIQISINEYKNEINKKLMIVNYSLEVANNKMNMLGAGVNADRSLIAFDNNVFNNGMHEQYCYEIHPKFKTTPIDIFNLNLSNGGSMFKQSLVCTVNGIANEDWINVLQAENVPTKKIVFDEYYTDTVEVAYTIDNTASWGTSRFNMIEIDPYIYGAYNIDYIEIFSLNEVSGIISETPLKTVTSISNIGKTRIILDEKVKFNKVVIHFNLKEIKTQINNVDIYPFGLRHIHFCEANFIENSTVIVPIRAKDYIEYIYNDIVIYQAGTAIHTTCDFYDIEIYTDFINNTLTGRVYTSSDAQAYRIAKNTKVLYAKVPLIWTNKANDDRQYLSLTGILFNYTVDENIFL